MTFIYREEMIASWVISCCLTTLRLHAREPMCRCSWGYSLAMITPTSSSKRSSMTTSATTPRLSNRSGLHDQNLFSGAISRSVCSSWMPFFCIKQDLGIVLGIMAMDLEMILSWTTVVWWNEWMNRTTVVSKNIFFVLRSLIRKYASGSGSW